MIVMHRVFAIQSHMTSVFRVRFWKGVPHQFRKIVLRPLHLLRTLIYILRVDCLAVALEPQLILSLHSGRFHLYRIHHIF